MSDRSQHFCCRHPEDGCSRQGPWREQTSHDVPHLGARALAHRHDAVLVRVQDLADLAHRLRVGGGRREVAAPVQAPVQAAPPVVSVRRVGQAPRHQRLALRDTRTRV